MEIDNNVSSAGVFLIRLAFNSIAAIDWFLHVMKRPSKGYLFTDSNDMPDPKDWGTRFYLQSAALSKYSLCTDGRNVAAFCASELSRRLKGLGVATAEAW